MRFNSSLACAGARFARLCASCVCVVHIVGVLPGSTGVRGAVSPPFSRGGGCSISPDVLNIVIQERIVAMQLFVMSVYDSKAGGFLAPFFVRSLGVGIRWFESCCVNVDHDFAKFPSDYTLFDLGTFGDTDGDFTLHPSPRAVVSALSVISNRKDN